MSEKKSTPENAAKPGDKAPEAQASVRGEVLWTTKLERASSNIHTQIQEVLKAILSGDFPTRTMSMVFLVSSGLLIFVVTIGVQRWWERGPGNPDKIKGQSEQSKQVSEFIKKQSKEAKTRAAIVSIGSFTVELKDPENDGKPARRTSGVMNMADLEIVLECADRDTRVFVEEHMAEVRNQITNVLVPVERDELFSREGKKRLRKRIIDKLNNWLPSGKVQDLYFPKLVVS